MQLHRSLDWLVKERLRRWPQRPPGIGGTAPWLRGRPAEEELRCYPFLKLPGSAGWRTLPDGLWLNFGGTPVDPYVDIFAIEACGSQQICWTSARGSRRARIHCLRSAQWTG